MKYHPESASILDQKKSHFNASHVKGMCEKCGINIAQEVHHLAFQQNANENGIILQNDMIFHKNNAANLLSLCEVCHNEMHISGKQYKKTKTTKGIILEEV